MKQILMGLCLVATFFSFSSAALGQDYDLEVTDFEGAYASPEGSGSGQFMGDDFELTLAKQDDGSFVAGIFGGEFVLAEPPQLLVDLQTLDWFGISLGIGEEFLYANIASVDAVLPKADYHLKGLRLKCGVVQTDDELDMMKAIINSCLTGGTLDASQITLNSEVEELAEDSVHSLVAGLLSSINETKKTEFKSLDLDIVDHKFKLKVKADVGMKATIKAEGTTNYNIELERIELRLDKAKASFFNIKEKIHVLNCLSRPSFY